MCRLAASSFSTSLICLIITTNEGRISCRKSKEKREWNGGKGDLKAEPGLDPPISC